ncbi:hypothetical protein [Synergistes jonesii]|nr:hypothetical protein [Synergistes jonesii]
MTAAGKATKPGGMSVIELTTAAIAIPRTPEPLLSSFEIVP